jgi:hypothetical protein
MARRPYTFVPVETPRERRGVGSLMRSFWRSRTLRVLFWIAAIVAICAGGYFLIACVAVIILGMFGVRFGMRRRRAYHWEQETRRDAPRNPYDV